MTRPMDSIVGLLARKRVIYAFDSDCNSTIWTKSRVGTNKLPHQCLYCGAAACIGLKYRRKTEPENVVHYDTFSFNLRMMTMDHVIPVSYGGSNHAANLRTLCEKCNSKRGNKVTPIDFQGLDLNICVKDKSLFMVMMQKHQPTILDEILKVL